MSQNTTTTYSSISGADIHAVFGNYKFGSIQMIKYAVSREKAPIYTLGSPSARATSRGKRSVNGAFIFSLIDKDGLVKAMSDVAGDGNKIFLNKDEAANYANTSATGKYKASDDYKRGIVAGGTVASQGVLGDSYTPYVDESIFNPKNFGDEASAYIADQLLPFDITVVGVPEYGSSFAKRLIIQGVEITTEASGTSIDDMVIEKQNAFIARNVIDWTPLTDLSTTGTGTNRFQTW